MDLKHKNLSYFLIFSILIYNISCKSRSFNDSKASSTNVEKVRSLRNDVETGKILSVENFQKRLQDYYSILVFNSRSSVQAASIKFPRIINFDRSGTAFYAIGGDPQSKGGNLLESIEYDSEKKRFDFYLYDFGSTIPKITKNPSNCLECHSSDPVPIWETYPTWPGVLGSEHSPIVNSRNTETNQKIGSEIAFSILDNPRYANIHISDKMAAGVNTLFGKVISRMLVERLNRILTDHLRTTGEKNALEALKYIPFGSHSKYYDTAEFKEFAEIFDQKNTNTVLLKLKELYSEQLNLNDKAKENRKNLLSKMNSIPDVSDITYYSDSIAAQICLKFIFKETNLKIQRLSSSFNAWEAQFGDGNMGLRNFELLIRGQNISDYPKPDKFDTLPF